MNKTLPYLQVARGIAALAVVFHHITAAEIFYFGSCSFSGIFNPGWSAVDFFFVLSGFIIYYIHGKDLGHSDRWRKYMEKRLIRIYPIYWFLALISLVMILVGHNHISRAGMSDLYADPGYILKSFFLIPQPNAPFLTVAWSLCFEIFFYLVFGLGILFNKKILWLFPLIYITVSLCQIVVPGIFGDNYLFMFLSTNFHLEFLLGILTAWCFITWQKNSAPQDQLPVNSRPSDKTLWLLRWSWLPGLLLFAAAWYGSLVNESVFGKFTIYSRLFYGIASMLIIIGIAQYQEIGKSMLARFFLLLGDASYSLYLVHPMVLALFFKLITRAGIHVQNKWMIVGIYLAASVCCVLTGIVLHKKVEKPMLGTLNGRIKRRKNSPVGN